MAQVTTLLTRAGILLGSGGIASPRLPLLKSYSSLIRLLLELFMFIFICTIFVQDKRFFEKLIWQFQKGVVNSKNQKIIQLFILLQKVRRSTILTSFNLPISSKSLFLKNFS